MMSGVLDQVQNWVLPAALWLLMFGIGVELRPGDFRALSANRRSVVLGVGSMLVMVPLFGVGIAIVLAPSPALLAGLILLATTPGGIISNVLTDLAKGNVALSVSISILVSLVYIFTLPFIAQAMLHAVFGQHASIDIPFTSSLLHILTVTLLPVMVGMGLRSFMPTARFPWLVPMKQCATAVLVIILLSVMAQQFDVLRTSFEPLIGAILAMNIVNMLWAFLITRLGKLSREDATAIVMEHIVRQEGTAIYVAVSIIGRSDMSLPLILNSFVGVAIASFITAVLRLRRSRDIAASLVTS